MCEPPLPRCRKEPHLPLGWPSHCQQKRSCFTPIVSPPHFPPLSTHSSIPGKGRLRELTTLLLPYCSLNCLSHMTGVLLNPLAKLQSGKRLFAHIFGTRPLPPSGPHQAAATTAAAAAATFRGRIQTGSARLDPIRIHQVGSASGQTRGQGQRGSGTPARGRPSGINAGAAAATPLFPKLPQHQWSTSSPAPSARPAEPPMAAPPWRLQCTNRDVLPLLRQMIGVLHH